MALDISPREYGEAEISTLGAVRLNMPAPETLDERIRLFPGTVAYTFFRYGGFRSGSIYVNGFRGDGSGWEHYGIAPLEVFSDLKKSCRVLNAYPIGRIGQPAKAMILVNVQSREMFVVDRHYFDQEVRPTLRETLAIWTQEASA